MNITFYLLKLTFLAVFPRRKGLLDTHTLRPIVEPLEELLGLEMGIGLPWLKLLNLRGGLTLKGRTTDLSSLEDIGTMALRIEPITQKLLS